MELLLAFLAYLESKVGRAFYCWTGQGEKISNEVRIRALETSKYNADRAIKLFNKLRRLLGVKELEAFDCSGLGMHWLQDIMHLFPSDMTADTLMRTKCVKITRAQVRRGDWTFRLNADGTARHVGYVATKDLKVIESAGRDDGVIKGSIDKLSKGVLYWEAFGRPIIFKDAIESAENDPVTSLPSTGTKVTAKISECPYRTPAASHDSGITFRGEDARWFEWQLLRIGCTPESIGCLNNLDDHGTDGVAGTKVWENIHYQQQCAGIAIGDADEHIRNYLVSVPSR